MEYALLVLSLLLIILGIIGSFAPVLPGPPLSWLGILCLYFIPAIPYNYTFLIISLVLTILITILDYIIPAQGTKRFGGSKYGVWGTNIGLLVGLFSPIPFGFIIGPFAGALLGEFLFDRKDLTSSLKSASGSLIGFLASTFIKFVFCMSFLGCFIYIVISYSHVWF